MAMDLETAIIIESAAPDSHFRLNNCGCCGGDNVAYVRYSHGRNREPWKVRCFDCGHTVDMQADAKHEAQVAWNKEKYDSDVIRHGSGQPLHQRVSGQIPGVLGPLQKAGETGMGRKESPDQGEPEQVHMPDLEARRPGQQEEIA